MKCPACGDRLRCVHTDGAIRWRKCPGCKLRVKTVEVFSKSGLALASDPLGNDASQGIMQEPEQTRGE